MFVQQWRVTSKSHRIIEIRELDVECHRRFLEVSMLCYDAEDDWFVHKICRVESPTEDSTLLFCRTCELNSRYVSAYATLQILHDISWIWIFYWDKWFSTSFCLFNSFMYFFPTSFSDESLWPSWYDVTYSSRSSFMIEKLRLIDAWQCQDRWQRQNLTFRLDDNNWQSRTSRGVSQLLILVHVISCRWSQLHIWMKYLTVRTRWDSFFAVFRSDARRKSFAERDEF